MLDATDKTILQELDKDVRTSLTQLAKRARISKEKAHYRLKRLHETKVITGYWGQQRLGKNAGAYKIFLKDKSLGNKKAELITFVKHYKQVAWVAETEGRWDIIISNYSTRDEDFVEFAQALFEKFGTALREKAITKMTKAIALNEKYLHTQPYVRIREDNFTETIAEYDETDTIIINEIAKNARVTYTTLAQATGLTVEAARIRFRKLIKNNAFVDLKVRINPEALDLAYYHVLLSLEEYETKEAVLSYYKQHPHCVYIMTHLGAYDIHLELVLETKELHAFLTDLSERFGAHLNTYETVRIVKEHKMTIQQ